MTERSVTHATFTITRHYDALPARVFAAFAQKERKAQWFGSHEGWTSQSYSFDFRTGGREYLSIAAADGVVHTFNALYQDIVPDTRIVPRRPRQCRSARDRDPVAARQPRSLARRRRTDEALGLKQGTCDRAPVFAEPGVPY
ncbi:MAG: SRPBCC domain-containing protein [Pararhizobium sp.]